MADDQQERWEQIFQAQHRVEDALGLPRWSMGPPLCACGARPGWLAEMRSAVAELATIHGLTLEPSPPPTAAGSGRVTLRDQEGGTYFVSSCPLCGSLEAFGPMGSDMAHALASGK